MSINKLNVNNTANDVGEWYINEELDLAYFSVFASDFVSLDTSTNVDDEPCSAIDALTSLYLPVSHPLWCIKTSVMRKDCYSWFQQDAMTKDQSFLEESSDW